MTDASTAAVGLESHPVADLFPSMSDEEYAALVEDIRENGQREPIWLHEDGRIIDGRHRARATAQLGVEPTTRTWHGAGSLVAFVVSLNLRRRHLNASQRATLALRLEPALAEEAKERQREHGGTAPGRTATPVELIPQVIAAEVVEQSKAREQAAVVVGVSGRYVQEAKRVQTQAPDLLPRVESGEITLTEASKEIRSRDKAAKVAEIAKQEPAPLAAEGTFAVLYADPPWRYDFAEAANREIENNYPTMTADDLAAMDVPADADAVLFMWATSPKLTEALDLMSAWKFNYVTCMVWVKDKIGMGYYARQRHELLLIGKRGTLRTPDPEDRPDSVIEAPRLEHSAKPAEVYALLERMYPFERRVELFARRQRDGWAAWGNQA